MLMKNSASIVAVTTDVGRRGGGGREREKKLKE